MHLLPCPSCQETVTIPPSQAGNEIKCPSCDASIKIPMLSELRQYPRAEQDKTQDNPPTRENSPGRQIGAGVLGIVALGALLIAGFCTVHWYRIKIDTTTESHISKAQKAYTDLDGARLIREFESMEKFSLDLPSPYNYRRTTVEKQKWGFNATIAGVITLIAGLAAFFLASTGRKSAQS